MFFKLFRKPAWENADVSLRAEAVAQSQDPQLLAKLTDFARHDTSSLVRRSAIKRINDPSLLFDRARLDNDNEVRVAADARLVHVLCSKDSPVERTSRERFLFSGADPALLEKVAVEATDVDLRKLALERITRAGFLQDRAIKEIDSKLKQWIIERIEDPVALTKIADQARKTDKTISRQARDKAQALLIRARDPGAIRELALQLCEEFSKRVHALESVNRTEWDQLRAQWDEHAAFIDADLVKRAQGYFRAVDADSAPPIEAPTREIVETVVQSSIVATAEIKTPTQREADHRLRQMLQKLEQQAEFISATALTKMRDQFNERSQKMDGEQLDDERCKNEFNALAASIANKHQEQEEQKRKLHHDQVEALKNLEHGLQEGQLAESLKAKSALDALLINKVEDASLKRRIEHAEAELKKLSNWARWGSNKQKVRICEELQAAIDTKMHPDAIASKVKELQAQWAKLETTEAEPDGLSRRFRAMCYHALAPAKSYFEKRKSIQTEKRADLELSVVDAEQALANDVSVAKLFEIKSQLHDCQRRVDEIEPAKRGEYGKRIRGLIESIQNKIESAQTNAAESKRNVIAQLKRQLARARGNESINFAKQAQQQWKTLARSDRKTDDALWEEFKTLIDPVFAEARAEKESLDQAETEKRNQAQTLIAEMISLSQSDDLHDNDTRVPALEQRWRELDHEDRNLQRDFGKARDQIDVAMVNRRKIAEQQSWNAILQAERELLASASASPVSNDLFSIPITTKADWSKLPNEIGAALKILQSNLATANSESPDSISNFVIQLETTVGLTSPAEYAEAQRLYRMQQLAQKLSRDSTTQNAMTPIQWYAQWLKQSSIKEPVRKNFQQRVNAAMKTMLPNCEFN